MSQHLTTDKWPPRKAAQLLCLAMMSCCFLLPTTAGAQLITTDLAPGLANARAVVITLTWPEPVVAEVEHRFDEMIFRLDRPLNQGAFSALAPRISKWVRNVLLGYDSVVVQLAPQVTANVAQSKGKIVIQLSAQTPEAPPAQGDRNTARDRLAFLKAVILWSIGEISAAADLLEKMGNAHPKNIEILAARSVVETRLDRWRRASILLHRAKSAQGLPSRGMLPVLGSNHAPHALVKWHDDRQEDGTIRQGMAVSGHGFMSAGLRMRAGYQYADVNAAPDAALRSFLDVKGHSSHLVTLQVRHDRTDGSWLGATLLGSPTPAGLRLQGERWDRWGSTNLSMSIREPRWELPVLIGLRAVRDALSVTRKLRSWSQLGRPLRGQITARMGLQLERWKLSGADESMVDLLASGSLLYVSWRAGPRLWAEYSVIHLQPLTTDTGDIHHATLVATLKQSHMHSLNIGAQQPIWNWLQMEAFGGYSLNYWDRNATQFGASLSWMPPSGFQLVARYQRVMQPATYGAMTAKLTIHAGGTF